MRVLQDYEPSDGPASLQTISPVSVRVPVKGRRSRLRVNKTIVSGAREIAENMCEAFPMSDSRIFEKLRQVTHCKANIGRLCSAEVAESTNGAAIVYSKAFEAIHFFGCSFGQVNVG